VNAYELKAGIGVIAGNTVWFMPEHLKSEVLHKVRYINTLTFELFTVIVSVIDVFVWLSSNLFHITTPTAFFLRFWHTNLAGY